jgi:glycosyltransferase involved in cell wall biosynthesis
MKKLIYVVNDLCVGGVTELVKNTTYELSKKYEIIIVSLGDNMSGWDNENDIRIKCFDVKIEYEYSLFAYFQDMVIGESITTPFKKVITYVAEQKPDILHFHTLPRFLKIGIAIKKQIHCQLVFSDHLVRIGSNEYSPTIRLLLGLIYRHVYRPYHLIFGCIAVENVAIRHHFIGKNRKHIRIDNGIDLKFYSHTKKVVGNKIIFIYVARISPVKGHIELVSSWANIKSDVERELWLVGPNEMGNTLQYEVDKKKIKNIRFLGARKDLKKLLSISDIALFPSKKEGLPLALLEKMAMNLPVIVSNIAELATVIDHEKDGLIYELGNNSDLTEKMTILLCDKEKRINLGRQARKKVEENYSIQAVIQKIETLYNSI